MCAGQTGLALAEDELDLDPAFMASQTPSTVCVESVEAPPVSEDCEVEAERPVDRRGAAVPGRYVVGRTAPVAVWPSGRGRLLLHLIVTGAAATGQRQRRRAPLPRRSPCRRTRLHHGRLTPLLDCSGRSVDSTSTTHGLPRVAIWSMSRCGTQRTASYQQPNGDAPPDPPSHSHRCRQATWLHACDTQAPQPHTAPTHARLTGRLRRRTDGDAEDGRRRTVSRPTLTPARVLPLVPALRGRTARPLRATRRAGPTGRDGRRPRSRRTARAAGRGPSPGPRRGPTPRPSPRTTSAGQRTRANSSQCASRIQGSRERSRCSGACSGRQPSSPSVITSAKKSPLTGFGGSAQGSSAPNHAVHRRAWRTAPARTPASAPTPAGPLSPSAEARMSQMTTAATRSGRGPRTARRSARPWSGRRGSPAPARAARSRRSRPVRTPPGNTAPRASRCVRDRAGRAPAPGGDGRAGGRWAPSARRGRAARAASARPAPARPSGAPSGSAYARGQARRRPPRARRPRRRSRSCRPARPCPGRDAVLPRREPQTARSRHVMPRDHPRTPFPARPTPAHGRG